MAVQTIPAVDQFIAEMRGLFGEPLSDEARWTRATALMQRLVRVDAVIERSASWPDTNYQNLLFYEDPDYGFVINGLVKKPDWQTRIHDHAHTWTLYGVLSGTETIDRYERLDDGARSDYAEIRHTLSFTAGAGDVDPVPPWLNHRESNGPGRTVALIIRSQKLGGFQQNRYKPETNFCFQEVGPPQVPHPF
jgi:predicted metal-dependent enzyme (double-stranded beta helix superfamily)